LETVVDREPVGLLMVAVLGPLVCTHASDATVVPLAAVAEPVRVTEFVGSVIVGSLPALTVGGVVTVVELPASVVSPCRNIHWKILDPAL
jgi:hypothetical protein